MRTKELKPNSMYATEAGTCVQTGETVERGWYRYRVTEKGQAERNDISKGLPGGAPADDPWGNQSSRRGTVRVGDIVLRDIVEGVKVTVHHVDGEGKSVKTFESVVDPKIIKGTWAAYVELHGDVLRSRAYKAEAEEAAKAESIRLNDLAKNAGLAGPDVSVRVTVMWMVDDRHKGDLKETTYLSHGQIARGYRLHPTLEVGGEKVEQLLFSYMSDGH